MSQSRNGRGLATAAVADVVDIAYLKIAGQWHNHILFHLLNPAE